MLFLGEAAPDVDVLDLAAVQLGNLFERLLDGERAEVVRTDGTVEEYAVVTALDVNERDLIRIHTGNGGGFGDPRRRPRELVLEDLRNGFATDEQAREIYGQE